MRSSPPPAPPAAAPSAPAGGPSPATSSSDGGPIVLYDGVCGLCHRFVGFIVRRDHRRLFRFASLQGEFAARALARHGLRVEGDPSSIVLLEGVGTPTERVLVRSDAVIAVAVGLGGPWTAVRWLRAIPRIVRDAVYGVVARSRYRLFGRLDACPLPAPADRARFVD